MRIDPTDQRLQRVMEIVYFTLSAIVLYLFSDWLLQRMEALAGRRFEHRSLVFFGLLLGLALVCFALIRNFVDPS